MNKGNIFISGFILVFVLIIGSISYGFLTNKMVEGDAPQLPESRMTLNLKTEVLENALSNQEWCEFREEYSQVRISSTETGSEIFERVINIDGNAKRMAEQFPALCEWSSKDGSSTFYITRTNKFAEKGSVAIPTWLLHSLIENKFLSIEQDDE